MVQWMNIYQNNTIIIIWSHTPSTSASGYYCRQSSKQSGRQSTKYQVKMQYEIFKFSTDCIVTEFNESSYSTLGQVCIIYTYAVCHKQQTNRIKALKKQLRNATKQGIGFLHGRILNTLA